VRLGTFGGKWRDNRRRARGQGLRGRRRQIEFVLGQALNNLAKLIAARDANPFDMLETMDNNLPMLTRANFSSAHSREDPNIASSPRGGLRRQQVKVWIT